jgi:hypothetical protein
MREYDLADIGLFLMCSGFAFFLVALTIRFIIWR